MEAKRIQIKHVLCPTDFSDFSARALRHAVAMAWRYDALLSVLHVVPDPVVYGGEMTYFPALDHAAIHEQAAEQLRRFVEPALLDRLRVALEVRDGVPWREIRAGAEQLPADLLVMGTHGLSGFEHLLLGSVTEKVLRSAECPVLTVCHEEGRTWQAPGLISRILCATDLSDSSAGTIAFALSLAAEHQAHVRFLHVIESLPQFGSKAFPPPFEIAPLRQELMQIASQTLHEAIPEDARAWCGIEERVEVGTAYKSILRLAAEERPDLIVMGSQGHSWLGTMLFGSTSQHVVRAATCPVLTMRSSRKAEVANLVRADTSLTTAG